MPIVASAGATFTPCPAGTFVATCIDVVDNGMVKSTYGGKTKTQHKVTIIWEIEEKRDDGKPHRPRKRYTLSLHEKSSLRKDLESWRGRAFTEGELEGFDLEVLLGIPCMISVIQEAKGGKVYANIKAIMTKPKNLPAPLPDPSYARECERMAADAESAGMDQSGPPDDQWEPPYDPSDVPF